MILRAVRFGLRAQARDAIFGDRGRWHCSQAQGSGILGGCWRRQARKSQNCHAWAGPRPERAGSLMCFYAFCKIAGRYRQAVSLKKAAQRPYRVWRRA